MSNQDPNLSREQEKYENPVPSREFILTHLQERSNLLTTHNYVKNSQSTMKNDK